MGLVAEDAGQTEEAGGMKEVQKKGGQKPEKDKGRKVLLSATSDKIGEQ